MQNLRYHPDDKECLSVSISRENLNNFYYRYLFIFSVLITYNVLYRNNKSMIDTEI